MAHFAELDIDNRVVRVIVISNNDLIGNTNQENEQIGIQLCKQIAGGDRWIQTSYNNNFRKKYANPGDIYINEKDVFYDPIPPADWFYLDHNYDWVCPIGIKPHNGEVVTDEEWHWLEIVYGLPGS